MFPYYSPAQQNYVSPYCDNAVVGRSLFFMVVITYNEDEEMMQIQNGRGEVIFYGNYSDFNRTPNGLSDFIQKLDEDVVLSNMFYRTIYAFVFRQPIL